MSPAPIPRWHVVLQASSTDSYAPPDRRRDRILELFMDVTGAHARHQVSHDTWEWLDRNQLVTTQIAVELYRAAIASYTADVRISREAAYDRWTREIVLHLPVASPDRWRDAAQVLGELLAFLTGDRWSIKVRRSRCLRPLPTPKHVRTSQSAVFDKVCLFSGGLDSLVGAIDQLEAGVSLALVGHNAQGMHRFSSPRQTLLHGELRRVYGHEAAHLFRFWVTPPAFDGMVERTQRARSILFLALGTLVASGAPKGTALVVPENGLISLNVPLTPGRLGSFSTRTTHPYALVLYERLLRELEIDVPVEFPYRFQTKGEMLVACANSDLLAKTARKSNSCAHPNEFNAERDRPQDHCGHCVPCIIRRAAMARAHLDSPSDYRYDVHADKKILESKPARIADIRAFRTAIAKFKSQGPSRLDVCSTGILGPHEVDRFVDLHKRGLSEVSRFLLGRDL